MANSYSFKDAILYICRMRFGYIEELKEIIGNSNLKLLQESGFLSCGKIFKEQFSMRSTWKVTEMARQYCKSMYGGVFNNL